MKIVDITEFYSERGGGVRSYLTAKGAAASAHAHDHLVIAPGSKNQQVTLLTEGSGRARLETIHGPSLPYDPTYHLLYRVDAVRKCVKREHPDVLEVHSPYVAALSGLSVPAKDFGIRTFVWHADFIDTYLRTSLESRLSRRKADMLLEPLWAAVRRIAAGCRATLVAARWQVEKLRGHGVQNVVHVPFGIDRNTFAPKALDLETRARWLKGAPEGAKLLVGIGRFAVEKRWDVVVDAFLRLRASQPAVLVLLGDGPERAQLTSQAEGHPDIHFAGFVSDRPALARLLASADLLVHGCPFETFGLALAEAMSCGLPAVVPDGGGAAELVDDTMGAHYKTGDSVACCEAIRQTLRRDLVALRHAASARATDCVPSVEEHFSQVFQLYTSLLDEHHAARSSKSA